MANLFGMTVPEPAAGSNPNPTGTATYYNADPTEYNALVAANSGAAPIAGAPPAPWVPPPNVQTPPQAASTYTPPQGNTPINGTQAQPTKGAPTSTVPASNFGQQATINGQPFTDNLAAFPSLMPAFANIPAGKGFSKGPSGQQNAAQPSMTGMPDTAANPMDFHNQLQGFINSGLLGGSQRLQG